MQFNSYLYILCFLPVITLIYYLAARINDRARKLVLITGSLIFYGYTDFKGMLILVISVILNLLFARLIESRPMKKLFLFLPVGINISLLLYFKYSNFALSNINSWFGTSFALKELLLPVGISFLTFQQIAYLVAAYRQEISVNIIDYVSYILYFPKLLMGPLMDPVDFLEQFQHPDSTKVNWDNLSYGIKIFSFGLLKKVLLADTFAKSVAWIFKHMNSMTSMDLILLMLFYTFEIYFDFSGYSDMAVGSSMLFNITLPINFDSPYKAISIRDFWKRWHISLTRFLTKYIYIPLGGSKHGILRTCINTIIVFLISGIWHGANWTFILWGFLHGLLSVVERIFDRFIKNVFEPLRWFVTFIITNILWLLFCSDSIEQWLSMLNKIRGFADTTISKGILDQFTFTEISFINRLFPAFKHFNQGVRGFFMIYYLLIASVICFLPENNYRKLKKLTFVSMILAAFAFVWGITCLGSESVFVYFNF